MRFTLIFAVMVLNSFFVCCCNISRETIQKVDPLENYSSDLHSASFARIRLYVTPGYFCDSL